MSTNRLTEFLPTISVVIPAYNASGFIKSALDSVQSQTHPAREVIIVDDGSKDETSQVVKTWALAHSGIRLKLLKQNNRGVGAARNTGIREASSEFVAFLDADDLWVPKKLEIMARRFGKDTSLDLLCHDERLEAVGRKPRRLKHGPHTTYRDMLFKGNPLSPSATVVRLQKLLEMGGFSEDLQFNSAEDYDLWLRLSKSGCQIEYLHEILGICRQNGYGITSNIEMHCDNFLRVIESHFYEWPQKTSYYRFLLRRQQAAVLRGACREFLHRGEKSKAQRFWRWSLATFPFSLKTWALAAKTSGLLNSQRRHGDVGITPIP